MVFVIGSGPTGVAAAHALLGQNVDVTMLDVGLDLEPERRRLVDELYDAPPERWDPRSIARFKEGMLATAGGIPEKLVYGSDYPFRDGGQAGSLEMNGAEVLASGARGGLSNAWGSNFLPYAARDMAGWCVTAEELAPHYEAVSSFVPISARHDDLDAFFAFHGREGAALDPSRQAAMLLEAMERHASALSTAGFTAGLARLAVQAQPAPENPRGCVYCGLCMYGCPYRLIYSSAQGLRRLEENPRFRYVPDVIVRKLVESETGVEIVSRDRRTGETVIHRGERVYLATGVISTTRILLESLDAWDTPLTLRDSQYFILPMLHYRNVPGVGDEALHTLAQVYVEIQDDALSRNLIQLQFYTYNDLYRAAIRSRLGPLFPLFRPLTSAFLGRLSVILGYLHSDDSSAIDVELCRDGGEGRLRATARLSGTPRRVIDGVVRKLWRHRDHFRAVPMKPLLRILPPGKSYHYGGSFPMRRDPGRFESDRWGRPGGLRRVHAVDATVLPSLAATTITCTAMANAHRIASEHRNLSG